MKIRGIVLGILLFTFFGCKYKKLYTQSQKDLNDCKSQLKIIEKTKENLEAEMIILDEKNLCDSDEALYRLETEYKNLKKYAKITLKIPKGFENPVKTKVEGNVITYKTEGDNFTGKWGKYKDKITFDKVYDSIIIINNLSST